MLTVKTNYNVAAYVWPAYSGKEKRTNIFWPDGKGEWQTVCNASGKFEGHNWPRQPLLGTLDEADPETMELYIDTATEHGVNVFIYDWYWYDRRPFLEQSLNEGFLKAKNNAKMKFYLMWANHDAMHLWDIRNSHDEETCVWRGDVDRKEFEIIARRLIYTYFDHPCYYKIGGKPVFSIYDFGNLQKGLGGLEGVRDAFEWFRDECVRCGLPGVHLQMIVQHPHVPDLSGVNGNACLLTPEDIVFLGVDSITHYQYLHFTDIDRSYPELLPDVENEWKTMAAQMPVPYFPHVSIGWDNNPRFKLFKPGILRENTPENVYRAFLMAKQHIDSTLLPVPLITVNSWNEWTESSYLLPDDLYGYGYLEAVRDAFLEKETQPVSETKKEPLHIGQPEKLHA